MTRRTLTLFGHIEEDGSLKRVTFDEAYTWQPDSCPTRRSRKLSS
jgi:hypothetical protein